MVFSNKQQKENHIEMDLNGQTLLIKNEGQKVLFLIRKAYFEGSLSVTDNIAPDIQQMLNKPLPISDKKFQPDPKDRQFLEDLIKMVESGAIKLFTPSSLLNLSVYNNLSSTHKAKADYDILIILNKIRAIKKLWDSGDKDSYQILNLVQSLRIAKEGIENIEGDVFII